MTAPGLIALQDAIKGEKDCNHATNLMWRSQRRFKGMVKVVCEAMMRGEDYRFHFGIYAKLLAALGFARLRVINPWKP